MTSCLPALPAPPRVQQLPALPVQLRVQPNKAHQLPASPALTPLLPANNEVEDEGDFLVVLIFFVVAEGRGFGMGITKKAIQFPESLFLFAQHERTLTGASPQTALIVGRLQPKARVSIVRWNLKEAGGKRLAR